MQKFSDFASEEEHLTGDKVALKSLFDKEIIVTAFKIRDSKFKDKYSKYVAVQFYEESDTTKRIFFTGSAVIMNLLEKYKDKLPFMTTIKKINKYYSFT